MSDIEFTPEEEASADLHETISQICNDLEGEPVFLRSWVVIAEVLGVRDGQLGVQVISDADLSPWGQGGLLLAATLQTHTAITGVLASDDEE